MSTFAKPKLDASIAAHDFGRFTAQTIIDPAHFRDAEASARQLGYSAVD